MRTPSVVPRLRFFKKGRAGISTLPASGWILIAVDPCLSPRDYYCSFCAGTRRALAFVSWNTSWKLKRGRIYWDMKRPKYIAHSRIFTFCAATKRHISVGWPRVPAPVVVGVWKLQCEKDKSETSGYINDNVQTKSQTSRIMASLNIPKKH